MGMRLFMWAAEKPPLGDVDGTDSPLTSLPESRTLTWGHFEGGYCMILWEEGKLVLKSDPQRTEHGQSWSCWTPDWPWTSVRREELPHSVTHEP